MTSLVCGGSGTATGLTENAVSHAIIQYSGHKGFTMQYDIAQFPELAKLLQSELKKRKEKAEKKK